MSDKAADVAVEKAPEEVKEDTKTSPTKRAAEDGDEVKVTKVQKTDKRNGDSNAHDSDDDEEEEDYDEEGEEGAADEEEEEDPEAADDDEEEEDEEA